MNVQELIDLLSKVEDKTITVEVQGCDCDAPAGGIEIQTPSEYFKRFQPDAETTLLITR